MATLFVLLLIGLFGGWEIVKAFFKWLSRLGGTKHTKAPTNTSSAPAQGNEQQEEKRPDLLDFDEFCDIMDDSEND